MLDTKKIIIFLTPISNSKNRKHCKELINNYCQQNNFQTSKIIEQNSFHHTNIRKLIDEIRNEPKGTFTILIEDIILNDPNSIIFTSSLGTLYLLGFIHTEIYKKSFQEIKLYDGINIKNDFLSIADFCLYYNLACYGNNSLEDKYTNE
ncbi:hypothetical protein [Rickettsia endosymbiont of Lasioglossum villosulum]|uniref:hypothetical protein n=1 Tax=Rickettsia endosymbiont of Lasioglossum villosulum TaxID=3066269 RepID=UPI003132B8B4